MSVERVREYLKQYGLEGRVKEFSVSSATVELAAQAVGVDAARIAKTLSFHLGEGCVLVVAAGDARIDNRKFKETFHTKAKMLTADEALAMTGHAVGGVCPFALPGGVRVCLDASLRRFDTIYPAAGSASSAVELSCEELQKSTGGEWVDVCQTAGGVHGKRPRVVTARAWSADRTLKRKDRPDKSGGDLFCALSQRDDRLTSLPMPQGPAS